MWFCIFQFSILCVTFWFQETDQKKFVRSVEAFGFPYYKIGMYLGHCKDEIIFVDQQVFGNVILNRIVDIYYKNEENKVSRVEIKVVINNTDCFAKSENGLGGKDFSGSLYLPSYGGHVLYRLVIFTCYTDFETDHHDSDEEVITESTTISNALTVDWEDMY